VSSYHQEPSSSAQPAGESAKQFLRGPQAVILALALVVVAWFAIGILTPEPLQTENSGSINYSGVAEVMEIGETPGKCSVYIKRDTGRETKQTMAKADCRKFRVGDKINMENGQYVSTVPDSYLGRLPS
jgi:hypothetical protein